MPTDLVTGAFGFTGSRIAKRLLDAGRDVRTLSRREAGEHPLAGRVRRVGYGFDEKHLRLALHGVDTVYATYWMRFPRGGQTWDDVVANVRALARTAAAVGVRRLIYISVVNARPDSSTAYFRAKAAAEEEVRNAGVDYAIVRPTLLFGEADILINNMAWALRRLPVFGVPGDGRYRVQPVYVGDVADLCLRLAEGEPDVETDAGGPVTCTYDELVRTVARAIRRTPRLIHLPPALVLATGRLIGVYVRDVVLTADELRELMGSLLASSADPTCPTRFDEWVARRGQKLGREWASELGRNFRLATR